MQPMLTGPAVARSHFTFLCLSFPTVIIRIVSALVMPTWKTPSCSASPFPTMVLDGLSHGRGDAAMPALCSFGVLGLAQPCLGEPRMRQQLLCAQAPLLPPTGCPGEHGQSRAGPASSGDHISSVQDTARRCAEDGQ